MLFADTTHPSTIAALLVEATLFGLAVAVGFLGAPVQSVRWLARGLAVVTLVLGLGFAAGMMLELLTTDLPFVVPEAPLGTYAQMIQIGLLVGVSTFALIAVGSALSFRSPIWVARSSCSQAPSACLMRCASACRTPHCRTRASSSECCC